MRGAESAYRDKVPGSGFSSLAAIILRGGPSLELLLREQNRNWTPRSLLPRQNSASDSAARRQKV